MTSTKSTEELAYRKYRAPKEHGSKLIEPSIASALAALPNGRYGRDEPASETLEFCGNSLVTSRNDARQEIASLAFRYTARVAQLLGIALPESLSTDESLGEVSERPFVMSGHQPELFHPGVWFKNFVLAAAHSNELQPDNRQSANQLLTINFIVDNDLCRSTSIQVPVRSADASIATKDIAFDAPGKDVPWEMRDIQDDTLFESFCRRISAELPSEITSPTIRHLWPKVREAVKAGLPLGGAVAAARMALEWQLGVRNLEVPLSEIAQTRSFARFSIQLLSQLPRFQQVYNDRLQDYRKAHKIRNHAHPVPALEEVGTWLEAPFWIYRDDAPERKRLWARTQGDVLELSDLEGWQVKIEGRLDCDNASSQWLSFAEQGVRLRPRALTTTMFTRVFVGDVFVHGIGGAKYDQLTDTIIAEFYGIPAPPVCVATATLHLPLDGESDDIASAVEQQKQKVWQLQHNPETYFDDDAEMQSLAAKKKELLADVPPHGEKWQWHIDLQDVKKRMKSLAAPSLSEAKNRLSELESNLRQQMTLGSREYSFCLFPFEETASKLRSLASNRE